MCAAPYRTHKPKRYRRGSNFSLLKSNFIALYTLVVLTCLITFWVWADRDKAREIRYIYNFQRVVSGDLYRFLTSGFLHGNINHLHNNMTTLLVYGVFLCYRTKMSNIKFFLFYTIAIIFSSYFAHQYYMHNLNEPNIQALGASGGVFAVRSASLVLGFPPGRRKNIKALRIVQIFVLCHFFFDAYNKVNMLRTDGIAHETHFAGVLYGSAFSIFCYPKLIFSNFLDDEPAKPKKSRKKPTYLF